MPHCRLVVLALLPVLGLLPRPGAASCLPIQDAEYQAIDLEINRDPDSALSQARERLQALGPAASVLKRGELIAIIAEALRLEDKRSVTLVQRNTLLAGIAALPPSAEVARLRHRLLTIEVMERSQPEQQRAHVGELSAALGESPLDPADQACLLAERALTHWEMGAMELATADAITAHRIASTHDLPDARNESDDALVKIYRWSRLTPYAVQTIEEAAKYAQDRHFTQLQVIIENARGRSLTLAGDFDGAQASFVSARQLLESRPHADSASVIVQRALLDESQCELTIARQDWGQAPAMCEIALHTHQAARPDHLALLQLLEARINLSRHQPRAAVVLLDAALASGETPLPGFRAQVYADRSRAVQALGRHGEALADLRRSVTMVEEEGLAAESRAVAVLTSSATAEQHLAEIHALEERSSLQARELSARRRAQWLSLALALGAVTIAGLLAVLAWVQRRNARRMAVRDATLAAMAGNAPDALMLLNAQQRVQFANRGLVGPTTPPRIGQPLADSLPPALRGPVGEVIDTLYASGRPIELEAVVTDPAGEERTFEIKGVPVVAHEQVAGAALRASDVTDARRLERDIVAAGTRERALIGRELHEGLGQELAGIAMLVGSLSRIGKKGEDALARAVTDIGSLVSTAVRNTRTPAERLSPLQIQRGSLLDALESLCTRLRARHGVRIDLQLPARDVAVTESAADHLYRIVEECVTQALLDQGVRHFTVSLQEDAESVVLGITNDRSSTVSGAGPASALGLKILAYRARVVGGTLRVREDAQGNSQILVTIPAQPVEEEPEELEDAES